MTSPNNRWWRYILLMVSLATILSVSWACSPQEPQTWEDPGAPDGWGQEKVGSETKDETIQETTPSDANEAVVERPSVGDLPESVPEQTGGEKKVATPEPLVIKQWKVVTLPASGLGDFVKQALDQGKFKYPDGDSYLGYKWTTVTTGAKGSVGKYPGNQVTYATAKITVKEDTKAVIRIDTIFTLYYRGARFIGDYYGSRSYRLPLLLKAGDNELVVQVMGGRNKPPELEAWTTPDEIYPNPSDMTTPSLIVGDKTEQCMGVPILNLLPKHIGSFKAEVLDSPYFEATSIEYPSLPKGASTQIAFHLKPKATFAKEKEVIPIALRLSSPDLQWSYTFEVKQTTIAAGVPYRGTRISKVDLSCQFHGVNPPKDIDPNKKYSLILSLHGAGVNALGQARSYAQKDWAYVVAPTNRRPFGFDWEAWGRLDGLEALAHAKKAFNIDPTKVYVTGHSMGGHGTWQFGVLFPGKFALAGPSAGWSSFYSYTGRRRPTSVFARSQASSDTNTYLSNLAKRAIYIIHGSKDNNVPLREGKDMYAAAQKVAKDVHYHEQPGAGHWWNVKNTPGTDCVDWKPMMDLIQKRTLDPTELEFTFKTPGSWVSPTHSYATILTSSNPLQDASIESSVADKTVTLKTTNVAALQLDGDALKAKGMDKIEVDGKSFPTANGTIKIGPQDGKRPDVHGPVHQVWHSPYCYVYPSQDSPFAHTVTFFISAWNFIGNGQVSCALPFDKLTDDIRKKYNIIYVGIPSQSIQAKQPFQWDETTVTMGTSKYNNVAMATVFPENGKLSAAFFATKGSEHLLFNIQPFTSSFVFPDYFVWSSSGGVSGGFFDAAWKFDPKYKVGR